LVALFAPSSSKEGGSQLHAFDMHRELRVTAMIASLMHERLVTSQYSHATALLRLMRRPSSTRQHAGGSTTGSTALFPVPRILPARTATRPGSAALRAAPLTGRRPTVTPVVRLGIYQARTDEQSSTGPSSQRQKMIIAVLHKTSARHARSPWRAGQPSILRTDLVLSMMSPNPAQRDRAKKHASRLQVSPSVPSLKVLEVCQVDEILTSTSQTAISSLGVHRPSLPHQAWRTGGRTLPGTLPRLARNPFPSCRLRRQVASTRSPEGRPPTCAVLDACCLAQPSDCASSFDQLGKSREILPSRLIESVSMRRSSSKQGNLE